MVSKKQLDALAKGRAIRAANCKKKNTKANYPKKQTKTTKKCKQTKKRTNISFGEIFDNYQNEYNSRRREEPKEPSPTLWNHIANAADVSWKALNSLSNAIGDGLYSIGDGVINGADYLLGGWRDDEEIEEPKIVKRKKKHSSKHTSNQSPLLLPPPPPIVATSRNQSRANSPPERPRSVPRPTIERRPANNPRPINKQSSPPTKAESSRAWEIIKAGGDVAKTIGDKSWELTKEYAPKAWDVAKTVGNKTWDLTKEYAPKAWDVAKEYGPKAWDAAMTYGNKAWDYTKEYAPKAWNYAKENVPKAWNLMRSGGRAAVEAAKGPQGNLAAMRVLITEITNKLDHFKTSPTQEELAELVEKSNTLQDLLIEEQNKNPDFSQKVAEEINAIPVSIHKIAESLHYDTHFI